MSVYIIGDQAFVKVADGTRGTAILLCIGSKAEVEHANEDRITTLINFAKAMNEWQAIKSSAARRLH